MSEINGQENTAIVMSSEDTGISGQLTSRTAMFCSMAANTPAEKVKLFNIMNNPEKRVKDCVNMTILVKDVFAEEVVLTNERTGLVSREPRIVLIDKDGTGYQCVSRGVFSALRKIIGIFGQPTWAKPIPMRPKLVNKSADRSILTIEIAAD